MRWIGREAATTSESTQIWQYSRAELARAPAHDRSSTFAESVEGISTKANTHRHSLLTSKGGVTTQWACTPSVCYLIAAYVVPYAYRCDKRSSNR